MLKELNYTPEKRNKTAFYAGDFGKPALDLFFQFKGMAPTNPPKWYDTLKWGAGKGVEEALLKILKSNGIVPEDYDQKAHGYVDIVREGVPVHGYIDAKDKNGNPIEIKSVNNANRFDILKYEKGRPRENYVGQLSVYMDALGVHSGLLVACSIDGLSRFEFACKRDGLKFKCGEIELDLEAEYKRWATIWDHVQKDEMPDIWQYRYKIPVDEIDWTKVSKSDIGKARQGKKVIGDWQVQYSEYKDKIIELQGSEIGYTPEELAYILEKTKGYTTW